MAPIWIIGYYTLEVIEKASLKSSFASIADRMGVTRVVAQERAKHRAKPILGTRLSKDCASHRQK